MGAEIRGVRACILLVENDAIQAMETADTLEAAGYSVIGPAATLDQAFRLMETADAIDAALLDIRLDEDSVYPLADFLKERSIPFAFLTGYRLETALPARFGGYAVLSKPWRPAELLATLARLIGSAQSDD